MNRTKLVRSFIVADFLSAAISWALFFFFRKLLIDTILPGFIHQSFIDINFYIGIVVIPMIWLSVYYLSGYYSFIYRKHPLTDFFITFRATLIGVVIIFFLFLLDDRVKDYRSYYLTGFTLFLLHLFFTYIFRFYLINKVRKRIRKGVVTFNTIVIGCGPNAEAIVKEISFDNSHSGNKFVGFIKNPSGNLCNLYSSLPELGELSNLPEIITKYGISEIIIAIEDNEQRDIPEIINWLGYTDIIVKALPELHQVLKGQVKLVNILGTPLIEVRHELLPAWQVAVKQMIDVVVSSIAIILFSPLMLFCALGIKLSSKGPVLFVQERIGKNGRPFKLLKFRSMYVDAEKHGPNLSSRNDARTTPFGRFMRNTKLDELPNFFNVLKGDMSLVGPRPERQYYIDQIVQVSPHYLQLQKIKPGITSLGQVKFGYAENVEQMVKRLRYDIIYMENMSIYTDLLIIYYTFVLLFRGRHI